MDFASCPSGTDRTTGTVGISRELSYTNSPVSVHLLFSFLPFFFRFSSMTNCCCYNQLYKSLSQQSLKLLCDILGHFSSLLCLGSMTSNTFFFFFLCVCRPNLKGNGFLRHLLNSSTTVNNPKW